MYNVYRVFDEQGNAYLVNAGDELDARIAVETKYPDYLIDEDNELDAELLFDESTAYMTVIEDM